MECTVAVTAVATAVTPPSQAKIPAKLGSSGLAKVASGGAVPGSGRTMAPASCEPGPPRQQDKGGRLASPAGPRRRRAPRVATAAPAREPSSCRPSLCPTRPALVLKDKEKGRWSQTVPAGHSLPTPRPVPTWLPPSPQSSAPRELGLRAQSWASEWEYPPNARPGSFPLLLPFRKEFATEFSTMEIFLPLP